MSPEKMVHMANQIAIFFRSQPDADPAQRVAAHLCDYWEPRMRAQLVDYVREGGEGLDETVRKAARLI
ncbi:formate dehydrogenase subunit delta [Palleronia sp. KMU-117]|uniref:formate dehydrogenase subunit delta n=1 Tax=Palleronia sp. KMU-117 TaxID=3434108 RepID=UPI003D73A85D